MGSREPSEVSEQGSHLADVGSIWQQTRGVGHPAQEVGGGKAGKNVVNVEGAVTRLDGRFCAGIKASHVFLPAIMTDKSDPFPSPFEITLLEKVPHYLLLLNSASGRSPIPFHL